MDGDDEREAVVPVGRGDIGGHRPTQLLVDHEGGQVSWHARPGGRSDQHRGLHGDAGVNVLVRSLNAHVSAVLPRSFLAMIEQEYDQDAADNEAQGRLPFDVLRRTELKLLTVIMHGLFFYFASDLRFSTYNRVSRVAASTLHFVSN